MAVAVLHGLHQLTHQASHITLAVVRAVCQAGHQVAALTQLCTQAYDCSSDGLVNKRPQITRALQGWTALMMTAITQACQERQCVS
eukprot:1157067-Pelagomonas_calceolata.AAC.11